MTTPPPTEALKRIKTMIDSPTVDPTPLDPYGRFEATWGDLRALIGALAQGAQNRSISQEAEKAIARFESATAKYDDGIHFEGADPVADFKTVIDEVRRLSGPAEAAGEAVALAHITLEDDGPYATLEILNGELLQPSMSPVKLYAKPPHSGQMMMTGAVVPRFMFDPSDQLLTIQWQNEAGEGVAVMLETITSDAEWAHNSGQQYGASVEPFDLEDGLPDECQAQIGLLSSSRSPADAASKWQPIETAPKSGARILLFQEGRGAFEGWWKADFPFSEEFWMDDADSEPEPTYWQPLLASPTQSGGAGNG